MVVFTLPSTTCTNTAAAINKICLLSDLEVFTNCGIFENVVYAGMCCVFFSYLLCF